MTLTTGCRIGTEKVPKTALRQVSVSITTSSMKTTNSRYQNKCQVEGIKMNVKFLRILRGATPVALVVLGLVTNSPSFSAQTGMNARVRLGAQTGMNLGVHPLVQLNLNVIARPDAQTGMNVIARPDAQTGMNVIARPDAQTGMNMIARPDAQTGMNVIARPDAQTGMNLIARPGAHSDITSALAGGAQKNEKCKATHDLQEGLDCN